jgi:hypothetical protein
MTGRWVLRFCEVCGRGFEVRGPEPGELDLDRIHSVFECCLSCGLAVGIPCCWDAEVGACSRCAAARSAGRGRPVTQRPDLRTVRRSISQLGTKILAMQRAGVALEDRFASTPIAPSVWEDAWWDAAWLILETERCGDAAAYVLIRSAGREMPPDEVDAGAMLRDLGGRHGDLGAELVAQVHAYFDARAAIEKKLVEAGLPLREAESQPFRPLRGPRVAMATAAVVAGLTVAASVAGFAMIGGALERPVGAGETPAGPTGAVLGVGGGSGRASPGATAAASPVLVASLDFNVLPIGTLKGATEDVTDVTGAPSVVSFPSPFDRSVRLVGAGPHTFCLTNQRVSPGAASVTVDVYTAGPISEAELQLGVASEPGNATVATIPLRQLDGLPSERWYRVEARWGGHTDVTFDIRQRGSPDVIAHGVSGATKFQSPTARGVCAAVSGMGQHSEVLLDNLQIEQ